MSLKELLKIGAKIFVQKERQDSKKVELDEPKKTEIDGHQLSQKLRLDIAEFEDLTMKYT